MARRGVQMIKISTQHCGIAFVGRKGLAIEPTALVTNTLRQRSIGIVLSAGDTDKKGRCVWRQTLEIALGILHTSVTIDALPLFEGLHLFEARECLADIVLGHHGVLQSFPIGDGRQ